MTSVPELPERSLVSILVVDAVDSTGRIAGLDPDLAEEIANATLGLIREPIERMGGILVSFSGDGGIGMFGWPGSLEDHADRACEAAWEIQEAAGRRRARRSGQDTPIHLRAGIHSGLIGLRQLVLDATRSLDLVGGTVHLAAHLERMAAPDTILVSSATLDLCQSVVETDPAGVTDALRKVGATANRLLSRPRRRTDREIIDRYRRPLIGREAELARLTGAVPRPGGTGEVLGVIGEPGIGKSHLLATALSATASEFPDVVVAPVIADGRISGAPFATARMLLHRLAGLAPTATGEELSARLDQMLGGIGQTHPDLAAFLAEARTPDQLAPDGSIRYQLMRDFVGAAGRLIGASPTLLAVEDLHLVDSESQQFLRELTALASTRALSIVVTARPEATPAVDALVHESIHLQPLDAGQVVALARTLAPGEALSDGELSVLAERTDGLPFAVEQIMLSRRMLGADATASLPSGVQSLVHARLNLLAPGVKEVAQSIAVVGADIEFAVATNVLRITAEELLRRLDELSGFAITHPFVGQSVRFRHSIVADACANTMPVARRRELHRRVVIALTSGSNAENPDNDRLAFHAQQAGDHADALEFLWLTLLQARANFASGTIVRTLARALVSVGELGDAAQDRYVDFVLVSFESILQMGELRMLVDHLPVVLELTRRQGRPDKTCLALSQLAILRWFEGDGVAGIEVAREALAAAEAAKAVPLIAHARFALAVNLHATGDVRRAIALMSELRDALSGDLERRRIGSAGVFGAMVRAFIGYFMADTGDFESGIAHAARALRVSREEEEPYTQLLSQIALGKLYVNAGRHREAIASLEDGLSLIRRHGYSAARPHVTGLIASAYAGSGLGEKGASLALECRDAEHLTRSGPLEECVLQIGLGDSSLVIGDRATAMAAWSRASEIAERIGNPALRLRCLDLEMRLFGKDDERRLARCGDEMARIRRTHDLSAPVLARN